ncbi:MAG: hypothetical protein HQL63_02470 [Magnetococcales bacterium]|nr:hypothetical protein [Magnetococcales bacterium]
MLQNQILKQELTGFSLQIDPSLPVIRYILEGEPIGVAIPRPGLGIPRANIEEDESFLPPLEKRWCCASGFLPQ